MSEEEVHRHSLTRPPWAILLRVVFRNYRSQLCANILVLLLSGMQADGKKQVP